MTHVGGDLGSTYVMISGPPPSALVRLLLNATEITWVLTMNLYDCSGSKLSPRSLDDVIVPGTRSLRLNKCVKCTVPNNYEYNNNGDVRNRLKYT